MHRLTFLRPVPKVHCDNPLRHPVAPPIDQDLVHMEPWRHRNRGLRLNDFDVAVVPLPRLRYIYRGSIGLRYAVLRLLQAGNETPFGCMSQLYSPERGLRDGDTSISDSKAASRLMEGRDSPNANVDGSNRRKR